jgi:hypothetical protein
MTIKAVVRDGLIQIIEPLPRDWTEGQELLVHEPSSDGTEELIDQWAKEMDAATAQIPASEHERFLRALAEIEWESKGSDTTGREQIHMVPTKFKSRLPKTLSWPVGAQDITTGLGDAPHVAECGLWFNESPVWRASEFRRTLREARPYPVLLVQYRAPIYVPYGRSHELEALGLYDADWQVHVNPVPREWRSSVRALLREQGLPTVAKWLRSFTGDGWQGRDHRLELVFAPVDGSLSKRLSGGE